jgi:endonuclease/exonuclease/phosphatase (EEP) superfamily protein YafD
MTLTQYHLPEKLTILNCHALNFVTTASWKKTIRAWFNEIPLHGACIVAGDFNTWNTTRLKHLHQFLYSKGFSYAPYKGNEVMRLDHIFVRDIHIENVQCHTRVHTSDHYPITMTFSVLP